MAQQSVAIASNIYNSVSNVVNQVSSLYSSDNFELLGQDKEILQIANKVYPKIREYYGLGKKEYPPIEVHKNILVRLTGEPEAEGEPADAEFDRRENNLQWLKKKFYY